MYCPAVGVVDRWVGRLVDHLPRRALGKWLRRVEVQGPSMLPTYVPGERLVAVRRWRPVRVGDVVVVRGPRDETYLLLKRCVERVGRTLVLRGDNPEFSTDSRDFGSVPVRDVVWLIPGSRPRGPRRES